MLLCGEEGAGKSTLLKALAGHVATGTQDRKAKASHKPYYQTQKGRKIPNPARTLNPKPLNSQSKEPETPEPTVIAFGGDVLGFRV